MHTLWGDIAVYGIIIAIVSFILLFFSHPHTSDPELHVSQRVIPIVLLGAGIILVAFQLAGKVAIW